MKVIESKATSAISYGGLIEKIEILRSTLRWASKLDRPQIQKLLNQCNSLRHEVMQLSHKERFVKASSGEKTRGRQTTAQRRKALLDRSFVFEGVFGESQKLIDALEIAEKAAPTDLPVLIDGESGTGKELMAKVIHANGSRADKSYISVNCGAIPDNLLESELFGHKRGAFTGASSDRSGKFETADKGTIFLDEIGELPLDLQSKLLRVLESGEMQRVGSKEERIVDVRVIAATNRDIEQEVRLGHFRSDLFFRLSVFPIESPPLRDRREDIPAIATFFLARSAAQVGKTFRGIDRVSMERLSAYGWPGNVRELRNVIERAVILCSGDTLTIEERLSGADRPAQSASSSLPQTLEKLERTQILQALESSGWKIKGPNGAADCLGLKPSTLRSRMQRLGISRP